jgi:CheY-like chemotaxis protein/anti-sigma regulatory factor (Ser/Thr protein kinase)
MASEGRLSQVFLNLFVNAAHAIDEGTVDANEIRVSTWSEDDIVCAEVRDTGKGIAPEHLGKLFEPFFTTKEVGVGSGLGLPISKGIVEGYGGTITVESEVGKGTSFTIRLPIRPQEIAPTPITAVAKDDVRVRGRILVVDDEDGIRAAMVRMLRGHETVEASTGKAAMKILAEDQAFDLILCDMMMPEVSGMDLHAWLSAECPRLARQLIFMTGGAFTSRARDYLKKVDNLRLEKPFDVANFQKIVGNVIRQAKANNE